MVPFSHKAAKCPQGYSKHKVIDCIKASPHHSQISCKRKTSLKVSYLLLLRPPQILNPLPCPHHPQQQLNYYLRFKCWEVGVYRNAA